MAHLEQHNLLSERQNAIKKRRKRATTVTVIRDLVKILDRGGKIDINLGL